MSDHDPDLERGVLRYVLAAPTSWRRLGDLRPADMAIPAHREILAAILEVAEGGTPPASDRVIDRLHKTSRLPAARTVTELLKGGAQDMAALSGAVAHLRRLSATRRLRDPLLSALALADAGDLEGAREAVAGLAESIASNADEDGYPWILDTKAVLAEAIDALKTRERASLFDEKGWSDLGDHIVPGNLVVLAGETGAGKSSLALRFALAWHARRGTKAGVVSLEDRGAVWGRRLYAADANADIGRPETITPWKADDVQASSAELSAEDPMHFAILEDHDVEHVTRYARALVQRDGCGLIVVDYLQEITDAVAARRGAPQHERLSGIARAVKRVAKTCHVPVILCSQLSRPDGKKHREPTIYDIKGSGDVENMAEAIILMWKESDDEHAECFAKVAKLKDSPARPRSLVVRNGAGAICELRDAPKRDAEVVNDDDFRRHQRGHA